MRTKCVAKKDAPLTAAVNLIRRQFGKGAIWNLADELPKERQEALSTGCLSLDLGLGIGGLPRGRVIEVYGPEASGKTTLVLEVIAALQARGGTAAYIDAEHALDLQYAKALGVLPERLLLSQPDYAEQALEITDTLVRSGAVHLVVIDSVAALVPKAEIEGEMGDSHVGLQARLMSQALRKLTSSANKSQTTVVFINQLRHKIGVMFGSPEVTTGGNALKYYSSVRLDIRRIGTIKKGEVATGNRVRVRIVKNKVCPPFKIAEFDIDFGKGVNKIGDLLDVSVDIGLVDKSGAWYSHGDAKMGQGRDRAIDWLTTNTDVAATLRAGVLSHHGLTSPKSGSLAS